MRGKSRQEKRESLAASAEPPPLRQMRSDRTPPADVLRVVRRDEIGYALTHELRNMRLSRLSLLSGVHLCNRTDGRLRTDGQYRPYRTLLYRADRSNGQPGHSR